MTTKYTGKYAGPDLGDTLVLIGVPTAAGSGTSGTCEGPAVLRAAGMGAALERAGWNVVVRDDLVPRQPSGATILLSRGRADNLAGVARWSCRVATEASAVLSAGRRPIFLGGDHTVSIGSIGAAARHWAKEGRPFFVLWLDAHADFNTPSTTLTGNLHGMVLAMLCGAFGSAAVFGIPDFPPLDAEKLLLVGTRAVDAMEGVHMRDYNLNVVHAGDVSSNTFASNLGRHLNGIRSA